MAMMVEPKGFPGGSVVKNPPGVSVSKESTCNVRNLGSIFGLGRSPGGGHGNSLQYSCLENPQGQRSLVGCSPPGQKESDTTEQLSTAKAGDMGSIPGSRRSPEVGNGSPLRYFCLENPMDRGAWRATFHAESDVTECAHTSDLYS